MRGIGVLQVPRSLANRVLILAAVTVVYAIILILFFDISNTQVFIVASLPVFFAAWSFGFAGSSIAAVALTAVHVVLIISAGGSLDEWISGGGGLGSLAFFVIGGLIGQNQSLRIRLNHERAVLLQTQDVTIFALAYEAELRDQATGKHLERTSEYVRILAEKLAELPKYENYLTEAYITDLVRATPLHDIGKVGIPDAILLKPGKLTAAEFSIMQEHCDLGAQVLSKAEERLTFQSFLRIAIQLACSHHEHWDGSGYPKGMKEDNIPLSGRIMALADVYDALRSERSYKPALDHEQCREIILAGRAPHFDPEVVDAFLETNEGFLWISTTMGDTVLPSVLEELKSADSEG